MAEIEVIEAAANVILRLSKDEGDLVFRLQSIAYAASIIKHRADAQAEKIIAAVEAQS
ncbi:hypothetical protein [Burkholderia ambifaria]|uniref:hypothetical protein n=1 Tax=Burkholderia ambifaria TaxID=152480 RepID=UPI003C79D857